MRVWKDVQDANLDEKIVQQIRDVGRKFDLNRIILFGSRATKKNWERSDIDLCLDIDDSELYLDVIEALENEVQTLLIFDVCNKNRFNYSLALDQEIQRDGVILYEKV
ncbi:MAG: nucleotidyltransferase domain-containing protein [Eubacteriales bacterium]|nr:nucleotidyltransferase domain-containing protein [Eubacteriales bacterium]